VMAADGNTEVVVEKDVLVEEFTRSETTHEEKVTFQVVLKVSTSSFVTIKKNSGQVSHAYVPLSPSSYKLVLAEGR